MRNWKSLCAALLCISLSVADLQGQTPVQIPAGAVAHSHELTLVLKEGRELEADRKWREALAHYEKAVRRFPRTRDLRDRLYVARSQFDLSRRYLDSSYVATLRSLDQRRALDIYSEVLLKLQTYYVNIPRWDEFFAHGIDSVQIAIVNQKFQQHQTQRPIDAIALSRWLQQEERQYLIRSRHDCRSAVANLSFKMEQQFGIRASGVVMEFVCAAVNSLDEYSAFLTTHQLDDVLSQIEGNFVGLGIELKPQSDELLVVSVIPGGPAANAGVAKNDRITAVDGKETKKVTPDVAADLLKGVEGSRVVVTLRKASGKVVRLQMTRRRVDVPSIEDAKIVDPATGVAYMRLSNFQKTTKMDITNVLWKLHHDGMRSLIIDVRGNPGGLLQAAVDVADKFIARGVLVKTQGRNISEDKTHIAQTQGTWRVPLVVLIDGDSASASEIFAGAIRDHGRGQVIGTTSYGKGSVQGIFPLTIAKVGLRLTTAKFYSPSGKAISRSGITPHMTVQTAAKPVDGTIPGDQDDPVLETGIRYARRLANGK